MDNFNELFKQINQSAQQMHSQVNGIPKISKKLNSTTNLEYKTKFFFIAEQTAADEFSEFMTMLINNQDKYSILREKENWTPSGELIRLIEYFEKTEADED